MPEALLVFLLALLPFAGNFAGGLLAEWVEVSEAWLNRALHAAAGIVVAVVAVEIMPEAVPVLTGWVIAAAFTVGGVLYLLADRFIEGRLQGEDADAAGGNDTQTGRRRMWMIYLAVATDLFGDGLMIGAGASVSAGLGLVLAVGQVLADLPEGFAAVATFKANGVPRRRRLALSASFILPTLGAAALAYLLLREASETAQLIGLVATAGLFTVAVFEDMIHEAHETADDSRTSTMALIGGFALFTLVAAGLG